MSRLNDVHSFTGYKSTSTIQNNINSNYWRHNTQWTLAIFVFFYLSFFFFIYLYWPSSFGNQCLLLYWWFVEIVGIHHTPCANWCVQFFVVVKDVPIGHKLEIAQNMNVWMPALSSWYFLIITINLWLWTEIASCT